MIRFDSVSKKYKLYSKGGLYLRDRLTHALQRFNPFNGAGSSAPGNQHSLERDFWALKDVSFEIKPGESVGFIGRNGAGKSTILKLLAGVTKPTSGKVEVNGRVAALIEVGAGFHPELTGRENIYLNGSILGMKRAEIERQFESIVDFAELKDFVDTPVKHYSSGMYVRLGFAIAAHTNPDIYLIDEVLAVGDEAFQEKCLRTLAAHKAAGKTMILVSHDLTKIKDVCDRCLYINHGSVVFDGPPNGAIGRYRQDVRGVNWAARDIAATDGWPISYNLVFFKPVRKIFDGADDKTFCFRLESLKPSSEDEYISVHVVTEDGVVLLQCDSRLTDYWLRGDTDIEGQFSFRTPWLKAGKYSLDVFLCRPESARKLERVCEFQVAEGAPYLYSSGRDASDKGLVLADFCWRSARL